MELDQHTRNSALLGYLAPQEDEFDPVSRELSLFLKNFTPTNKLGLYKEEINFSHQEFNPLNQSTSTLMTSFSTNLDLLQR
jgi:hypothetical protein